MNIVVSAMLPVLFCLVLSGCGGQQSETAPTLPPVSNVPTEPMPEAGPNQAVPDNRQLNSLQILLFGNSHSGSHNLPGTLQTLLQQGTAKPSARCALAARLIWTSGLKIRSAGLCSKTVNGPI